MKKDQEQPLDQDLVEEETPEQKAFREFMEDIAHVAAEDYLKERKEK